MSSTKKRRDLNRAIEEHKTVRLSAQLATSNHAMLNIAESILAKDNEALRAQIAELTERLRLSEALRTSDMETTAEQATQIEMLRGVLTNMQRAGRKQGWQQSYESEMDACAETLAIPTDSKQVLSDWLDSVLGEPIAWSHHCSDNNDQEFYCVDYEPNNGMSVHRGDVPLFKKPEILEMTTELESLRQENAALLVAIETKDAALMYVREQCLFADDEGGIGVTQEPQIDSLAFDSICKALTLPPSTELLEARDRKRDAKLLRLVASHWNYDQLAYPRSHIENVAHDRESGEWIPELGD